MGKGSARRKEDSQKVRDNWDAIFNKENKAPEGLKNIIDAAIVCKYAGCQHPKTCANPFCSCNTSEVKSWNQQK